MFGRQKKHHVMLNVEQFSSIFPRAESPEQWVDVLINTLPNNNINNAERVAAFLSQCGYETGGWRWFEENLNYSAQRMQQVWPRTFTPQLAARCHRKPEMVANYAYANRMGNGDPESGDGWKYRGRGPIHLTGRSNYTRFAVDCFDNPLIIIENPDLVALDKEVAIKSAIWFWNTNDLNVLADAKQLDVLTRRINGSTRGLGQRIDMFEQIYHILK